MGQNNSKDTTTQQDESRADTEVANKVGEIVTCPLCLGTLSEPSTLACFHNFCTPCTRGLKPITKDGQAGYECPMCRAFTEINDVKRNNVLLNQILDIYNQMVRDKSTTCSRCNKELSKWKCVECKKQFCDDCRSTHDEFLDQHTVVSTSNSETQSCDKAPLKCNVHPNQDMELFCTKCRIGICRQCQRLLHMDHTTQPLDAVIRNVTEQIQSLSDRVRANLTLAKSKIEEVKTDTEASKVKFEKDKTSLKERHLREKLQLEAKHKVEETKLNDAYRSEIDQHVQVTSTLENHVAEYQSVLDLADSAVNQPNAFSQLLLFESGLREKLTTLSAGSVPCLHQSEQTDDVKAEAGKKSETEIPFAETASPISGVRNNMRYNFDIQAAMNEKELAKSRSLLIRGAPADKGYLIFNIFWNQLWVPSPEKPQIQIYSTQGKWLRSLEVARLGDIGITHIVKTAQRQIAFVTANGIYTMSRNGENLHCLRTGDYCNLCVNEDKLYACADWTNKIDVFDQGPNWNYCGTITLGKSYNIESFYVDGESILIGTWKFNCILEFSKQGKYQKSLNFPQFWVNEDEKGVDLCGLDSSGNLLVSHCKGNFVALIDRQTRRWYQLQFANDLNGPRYASFEDECTLWVLHGDRNNQLTRFETQ